MITHLNDRLKYVTDDKIKKTKLNGRAKHVPEHLGNIAEVARQGKKLVTEKSGLHQFRVHPCVFRSSLVEYEVRHSLNRVHCGFLATYCCYCVGCCVA